MVVELGVTVEVGVVLCEGEGFEEVVLVLDSLVDDHDVLAFLY